MALRTFLPLLTLLSLPLAAIAQGKQPDGVKLIRSLYDAYAWEAVDGTSSSKRPFIDEPRKELLKYLEPGLASLLRKDRKCAERTRAVCKLDFAPLWGSQDPGAEQLRVVGTTDRDVVEVKFNYPGSDRAVLLSYKLVETPAGLRVADITYGPGASLLRRLGGSQ